MPARRTTCRLTDKPVLIKESHDVSDSVQFYNNNGTQTPYRWEVNKIIAPNDNNGFYKLILVSYFAPISQAATTIRTPTTTPGVCKS